MKKGDKVTFPKGIMLCTTPPNHPIQFDKPVVGVYQGVNTAYDCHFLELQTGDKWDGVIVFATGAVLEFLSETTE